MIRMSEIIRTYSELIHLPTFEERFEYLKLNGRVGADTFGFDRIFNQKFYTSNEWRGPGGIRDYVITRDGGCDLAIPDRPIYGERIIIHHLNPITIKDIELATDILLNPEFLICTVHSTHNAIHYSDSNLILKAPIERTKNDTCPWRK